jgi:Cd2+/Zn2+-exporting ATPase
MADEIRPEAREAIARLREIGIQKIIMISGDDRRVAQAVARSLDIDEFHGELMPEDKVRLVRSLQNTGPAAMVGDGVNDAPSLAAATVGVAMGSGGTDIAMETADIVLMGNRLDRLALALKISRRARRVVLQNLIFAGGVMVVLTMAALGNQLPLTLGVAGHEGSTVLVCLNGLRLLAVRKTH